MWVFSRKKPRRYLGARLTVLRSHAFTDRARPWLVRYVTSVDHRGVVWYWTCPDQGDFATWQEAMDHAATLCPNFGDQSRRRAREAMERHAAQEAVSHDV